MKSKKFLLIVPAVFFLAGMVYVIGNNEDTIVKKLKRPEYSEAMDAYSLTAKVDEEEYAVEIPVKPMKISEEKLQSCFEDAFEIVCNEMLGENESFDMIKNNLVLIDVVEKYGIGVSYLSSDYSIINSLGEVKNNNVSSAGEECEITINLEYEDRLQSYKVVARVYPPELSEEEEFINSLESIIEDENNVAGEEYLVLPEEINGQQVTFVEKSESKIPVLVILVLIVVLFWYYKTFVVKRNKEKAREEQLEMDYAEVVSKLSLLMGAGMSGVNAFNKIATDYKLGLERKEPKRYAYDEIVATVNRISTGTSESDAYALFGRLCKSHCYIKLGSLLAQNVKKGGEGFTNALRNEATEAFVERKSRARKAGEEAGTKLLLPMGLMLCVVLVVIIVPAFMSF